MIEIEVSPETQDLQERCGIVGVYSPEPARNLSLALLAASGVQHRGQQGAGIALKTEDEILTHAGNGFLRDVFTPQKTTEFDKPNIWSLIHCRYGTYGEYNKANLQPCIATSIDGEEIAVVHNGEFVVPENIRRQISSIPDGASDTYIFTQFLAQVSGSSWEEKITKTLSQFKGAYSLIIGIEDSLFVTRDEFGIRPLFLGKNGETWLIASETHAFDKVGISEVRQVKRGELTEIRRREIKIIREGRVGPGHFCDFEWPYFSRPDSRMPSDSNPDLWLSFATFREQCGAILAQEAPIKDASFVVGIPDSGVAVGTGYANALGLPYKQVILRDHFDQNGDQRTFMRDDAKEQIKSRVVGKLSFVADNNLWKDAVVVVADDSIVRGNVSSAINERLWSLGVREVHWVVGFPPVQHTCHLGVSMRTQEDLIAVKHCGDPKEIAKAIAATSVNYISHKGFIKARLGTDPQMPENQQEIFLDNGGCGGCITGIYPISKEGIIYQKQI